MGYNQKILQTTKLEEKVSYEKTDKRNVYYGEVVSVDDPTDGGRIKVKIKGLDNKITDNNELPDCYPLLPKFFHVYPKVGEVVRIFIEDVKYPMRGRFWLGSVISQPHKFDFDSIYSALSTTNMSLFPPDEAPSTYPDFKGLFPEKEDIALIGRDNTDFILKGTQATLRVGKHEVNDVLKLNKKNPATITLSFEPLKNNNDNENPTYYSNTIIQSDKIALITHSGNPNFKTNQLDENDRENIFKNSHPIVRGDELINILNIFRNAIINHIHGYSKLEADKNTIIKDLENLDLQTMIQDNIVIN